MARSIERALTKEQQRTAKIVPVDDANAWVVWQQQANGKPVIGIEKATNCADVWECDHTQTWPADTMFAVADLIANDVARDRQPPPIEDPVLDALACDPYSTVRAKWLVPIDDDNVMIVYRYDYREVPSLKLKTFERKQAWQDVTYTILDETSALEIAKHIAAMRGGATATSGKASAKAANGKPAKQAAGSQPSKKSAASTSAKRSAGSTSAKRFAVSKPAKKSAASKPATKSTASKKSASKKTPSKSAARTKSART